MSWAEQTKNYPKLRRVAVIIGGGTIISLGGLMLFLPGPAIVFIPLGLAILGTEFLWARRLLLKTKEKIGWKKKTPLP